MAYRPSEPWVSENQMIVAVALKGGGFAYYVHSAAVKTNGRVLKDDPIIAREISNLNLEIINEKVK